VRTPTSGALLVHYSSFAGHMFRMCHPTNRHTCGADISCASASPFVAVVPDPQQRLSLITLLQTTLHVFTPALSNVKAREVCRE
jgi:hypothetical protein